MSKENLMERALYPWGVNSALAEAAREAMKLYIWGAWDLEVSCLGPGVCHPYKRPAKTSAFPCVMIL